MHQFINESIGQFGVPALHGIEIPLIPVLRVFVEVVEYLRDVGYPGEVGAVGIVRVNRSLCTCPAGTCGTGHRRQTEVLINDPKKQPNPFLRNLNNFAIVFHEIPNPIISTGKSYFYISLSELS
ncbi:MAG: hypothetical protein J6T90_00620 [Methanomicrobium sp.]|nr:hypothetical protein [Methanomicrobium sp.]